jgi:DNA-binding MarR family transcriptional regulator
VLPTEIQARWRKRFGAAEIDALERALRVVDDDVDAGLPEYLPIVSSTHDLALELGEQNQERPDDRPLVVLLAHALMAYTLDFEAATPLSLPLSANVLRVLDGDGVPVRDLPSLTGVSKEAVEVSLTSLGRTEYVVVEGSPASKRVIRLTTSGEKLRADQGRLHGRIEKQWGTRFGANAGRLRVALDRVLEHPKLSVGLTPYSDGWRASKSYAQGTQALLDDPRGRLPHCPMVLHRGGWPDGS